MACPFDLQQLGTRRYELARRRHFVDAAKAVAGAVNEQCRSVKAGKMSRAELVRAFGRVQRIGQQEQCVDESRFGRRQDRSLPSAVGVSSKEYRTTNLSAHRFDGAVQALLITLGGTAGWPVRLPLTKRQIAAENGHADFREGGCECDEQRGPAVGSGAMSEDETVT